MINLETISPIIIAITLWTIPWKGYALWKAARKKHMIWFIVLLLISTAALLEIAYIFYFSDKKIRFNSNKVKKKTSKTHE